jgi:glycosyltransferase involved in cell wall biosynthesis
MPSSTPKVVLAVNGVFHHFDLAHELARRDMLRSIYSTFHWGRLRREGLDRRYVRMFPWVHPAQIALHRAVSVPPSVDRYIDRAVRWSLDRYVAGTLPECDVYVALSSSGQRSGRVAQSRGCTYICDRGSSHIRYQDQILQEEYRMWGYGGTAVDPYFVTREEAEYAQADAITVPSSFAMRSFMEMGVPEEKLYRIPYGVRLDRFRRVSEPPKDEFRVLFAGTVSLRKGVPYLLQAFREFRHPRKRLLLVGPVLPEMQRLFSRFDLTDVEVVGAVPQTKMAEYMSSSHVMVLPSIEEGLALVQGQALACGCPLISSVNTGGEDLFSNGVEGFQVPIRSAGAITERLQELADDPDLRQRMSEAAIARVKGLGGWSDYGDAWARLISDLVVHRQDIGGTGASASG